MVHEANKGLKGLAAVASGANVARLVEQAHMTGSFGQAILGSSTLQRELALASEVSRDLTFQNSVMGTLALHDRMLRDSGILEHTKLYEQSSIMALAKASGDSYSTYLNLIKSPAYSAIQDALRGYNEQIDAVTGRILTRFPKLTGVAQRVQELQDSCHAMIAPTVAWQKQNFDNLSAITSASQRLVEQISLATQPWSAVSDALRENQAVIVSGFARMDRATIEAYARAIYEEDELASLLDDQEGLAENIFQRLVSNTGDEVRTMGLIQLLLILLTVWQIAQGSDYTDEDRARDVATNGLIEAFSDMIEVEADRLEVIEALPRAIVKARVANVRAKPHGEAELRWRLEMNQGVFIETIQGRWVEVYYRNGVLDTLEKGWIWRESLIIGGRDS